MNLPQNLISFGVNLSATQFAELVPAMDERRVVVLVRRIEDNAVMEFIEAPWQTFVGRSATITSFTKNIFDKWFKSVNYSFTVYFKE